MINLFDKWDQAARNFKLAQLIAQLNIPAVVIDDDGFLPREIQSPMQYYCSHTNDGKPLYFDQIPVPRFWRIVGNSNGAQIYDLNHKRADVIFTKKTTPGWLNRSAGKTRLVNCNGLMSMINMVICLPRPAGAIIKRALSNTLTKKAGS